jgi:hypothetical protein
MISFFNFLSFSFIFYKTKKVIKNTPRTTAKPSAYVLRPMPSSLRQLPSLCQGGHRPSMAYADGLSGLTTWLVGRSANGKAVGVGVGP